MGIMLYSLSYIINQSTQDMCDAFHMAPVFAGRDAVGSGWVEYKRLYNYLCYFGGSLL